MIGAASLAGAQAVAILRGEGREVYCFSRQKCSGEGEWCRLVDTPTEWIPLWIDFGHVWNLKERCKELKTRGASKIVITSSTSRFAKSRIGYSREAETAEKMIDGEEKFASWCKANGIEWVIPRPTLICGRGRDKKISKIARMILRFGLFPIFGAGKVRRQPVQADDVASACVQALQSPARDKAYNISGGEVLSYRERFERVFIALGRMPRIHRLAAYVLRGSDDPKSRPAVFAMEPADG